MHANQEHHRLAPQIKNQPGTLLRNFLFANSPWQQIENKNLSRAIFLEFFSFLFFSPSHTSSCYPSPSPLSIIILILLVKENIPS